MPARSDSAAPDPQIVDGPPPAVTVDGELVRFLRWAGLAENVVDYALDRARAIGSSADRVIVTEGYMSSDALYRALARWLGADFVEGDFAPHEATSAAAARAGLVLLADGGPWRWLVAPEGERLAAFVADRERRDRQSLAVTTPAHLNRGLLRHRRARLADAAANCVASTSVFPSFRHVPTMGQVVAFAVVFTAVGFVAVLHPSATLGIGLAAGGLMFLFMLSIRLAAIDAGRSAGRPYQPARSDAGLPVYTVLVPLCREARVVPALVGHLRRLDYPAAKLDIKLLIEEDDHETQVAVEALALDAPFEIVLCPPGQPRTKPRALNVGLSFARGDFIVVYDAEDRPEPDQLRKAVTGFWEADDDVVCLQAALAIHNAGEGWLARLFAIEYAILFDVIVPGLARLSLPVPLGGTSNHFRTAFLNGLSGWDAWNVTEDADLGLRIAEEGFRVGVLNSTTFEEAPFEVRIWTRQRIRWLKGWLQTGLARLRLRVGWRRAGWFKSLIVFVHSWSPVAAALISPVVMVIYGSRFVDGTAFAAKDGLTAAADVMTAALVVLSVATLGWSALIAAKARQVRIQIRDLALAPVYLGLISFAGWCAVRELAVAPMRWNKTPHGRSRAAHPAGLAATPIQTHQPGRVAAKQSRR